MGKTKKIAYLINILVAILLLSLFLLFIALMRDNALKFINEVFQSVINNKGLLVIEIIFFLAFIAYAIINSINNKLIFKGLVGYSFFASIFFLIYNQERFVYYLSRLSNPSTIFIKKFLLISSLIYLFLAFIYIMYLIVGFILILIRDKFIKQQAPLLLASELKSTIGLYYLDFDYDDKTNYEAVYESNDERIVEKLTFRNLLTKVGHLKPDIEYNIYIRAYGKIDKEFAKTPSSNSVKFVLRNNSSAIQRKVADYKDKNEKMIGLYIEALDVFNAYYKRSLLRSPEVHIMESINRKSVFAKMTLLDDSLVFHFNFNPYLLDSKLNIINAFDEDFNLPTKFVLKSKEDLENLKNIVETIKILKKKM